MCGYMIMILQVRSQKDGLRFELQENKRYTEALKQNFEKESEKIKVTDDDFSKTKESLKRLNENAKEVEKIWNDIKQSMEKFFSVKVCF